MHNKREEMAASVVTKVPLICVMDYYFMTDSLSQGKDKVVGDQVVSKQIINSLLQVLGYLGGKSFTT